MDAGEKIAEYERRIAPVREKYEKEQERLEAEADFFRKEITARAAQGRTGGRYWALGLALAAMAVQPQVDEIAAKLAADLKALFDDYQAQSRAIREELGL